MKATGLILIFGLLTRAFAAPVDINVDKKGGPRVSTKEILNLEQQLKAQAGEDKKFFPSEMQKSKHVPPQQQVDGLEEHDDEEEDEDQNILAKPAQQDPAPALSDIDPGQALLNLDNVETDDQILQPIPGQLDLAQQDELEAAQKKRDHHDNSIDDDVDMTEGKNFYPGKDAILDMAEGSEADVEEEQEAEEAEEEAEGQREDEEALFMQSVIEALRDRPDLLQQFLEGRLDDAVPEDPRGPAAVAEDEADRADVIRAEYLAATRGRQGGEGRYIPSELLQEQQLAKPLQEEALRELEESDSPTAAEREEAELAQQRYAALERFQNYRGDKGARVVKKSYQWAGAEDDKDDSPESDSSEESKSQSQEEEEDKSDESAENELKEARKRVAQPFSM